jgi:hypothetical protein
LVELHFSDFFTNSSGHPAVDSTKSDVSKNDILPTVLIGIKLVRRVCTHKCCLSERSRILFFRSLDSVSNWSIGGFKVLLLSTGVS